MLPINRLDKFLFICLYNFANSFKLYIYPGLCNRKSA